MFLSEAMEASTSRPSKQEAQDKLTESKEALKTFEEINVDGVTS